MVGMPIKYVIYIISFSLQQVLAVVADNATNNDTMMVELEDMFKKKGVRFSATQSRLRCTPHTIHLAAMKVCRTFFFHVVI